MTRTLPDWHAEIIELHDFFQGWLDGTLPEADAVYGRLAATMASEFTLITPEGERIGYDQAIVQFRPTYNTRPGWRMWIERAELRLRQGGLLLTTYEEWHRFADGRVTGRACTALFREQAGTPNGLAWLHIHETWLPEAVQRAGRPAEDGRDQERAEKP
jgi:hypothetical protein